MINEVLKKRGWPIRDENLVGRFSFDLLTGEDAFVALDFMMPRDKADALISVSQTVLGDTPFIAYKGDESATALYRTDGDQKANQSWQTKAGGTIGIRWGGAPITLTAENANVLRWFRHPATFTPADLPVVTEDLITEAMDAIDKVSRIDTLKDVPNPLAAITDQTLAVGVAPNAKLGAPWGVNREGRVIRGGQRWLQEIAKHWLINSELFSEDLFSAIKANYEATTDLTIPVLRKIIDEAHIEDLVENIEGAIFRGRVNGRRSDKIRRADIEICASEPFWMDDIAPSETRSKIAFYPFEEAAGQEEFQALDASLDVALTALRGVVGAAIDAFLNDVDRGDKTKRVLNVPPGTGKTTQVLESLLARHDLLQIPKQIGFFAPNYDNLAELRQRIDTSGRDILWLPIMNPMDRYLLEDPNLIKVMVFGGRIHAGCMIPEKMELAMEVGQGAQLCNAKDEEDEEIYCPHYGECPAIAQRQQVGRAEIVLLPHQFLVVSQPEELDSLKGLVVDERTDPLFLRTEIIPTSEITAPRRNVRVPKELARAGITSDSLAEARAFAWAEVLKVMRDGYDPATAIAQSSDLKRLVSLTKEYCALAKTRNLRVSPSTPIEVLRSASEQITVKWLSEESVFWDVLLDDVDSGRMQTKRITLLAQDGIEHIRLAWRETPNWSDRPVLMLDGSASEKIVGKIWSADSLVGSGLVVHRSLPHETALNAALPTILVQGDSYAKSSLLPRDTRDDQAVLDAAMLIDRLRSIVISIAGRNADNRVLVGGMKAVLKAIRNGWCEPQNVDFAHYGALRGLNAFEKHTVAISIGRFEIPPEIIQGAVSALSYDDTEEVRAGEETSQSVTLYMRDRRRIAVPSSTAGGTWERALQVASREEEMRQFAGRLRAIQRIGQMADGVAWVVIGNVLPEGSVVDGIVSADDVAADRFFPLLEAARRTGGIIIESRYAEIITDLPSVENQQELFQAFLRQPSVGQAWRLYERVVSGKTTRVLAPANMAEDHFIRLLARVEGIPEWTEMVTNACLGEVLSEAEWGGMSGELERISSAYSALGLNPETGANYTGSELPMRYLPWPGSDGVLLPARIVMAGLALQEPRRAG